MPSLLNDCDECYKQEIDQCSEILVFNLGLAADTEYVFTFLDGHNKRHNISVTTDELGIATIDTADLPLGFFIVYAGVKTVTIREAGACEDLCFNLCGDELRPACCIILTPVDISGISADVIETEIPCCPDGSETLVFTSISYICNEPLDGEGTVSLAGTVINGSGSYAIQLYLEGDWNTGGAFSGTPSGEINNSFDIKTSEEISLPVRLIDTVTLVVSNELELTILNCAGDEESLEIIGVVSQTCTEGVLIALVQSVFTNVLNPVELWVNGFYIQHVTPNAPVTFTQVQGQNNIALFLRDSVTAVESPTFYVNFIECEIPPPPSVISLAGVQLTAPFTLRHIYSNTNVYEYTGALLDLLREYSTDNITFVPISNVGGWLSLNPDNTTHANIASASTPYISGNFVRLTGRNSGGDLISSNSLQIVSEPEITKLVPYCFANQSGVTIGGLVDILYAQNYFIEYRIAGSGDPYTQLGEYVATGGVLGDWALPVGAGNQYASTSLEFRLRSATNGFIFSPDITVLMSPAC